MDDLVIEGLALLAVAAHGVVLAIVAHAAGNPSGGLVHGRIKVAPVRVVVAVAALARVRLAADGGPPRQVVVKVLALLAVESARVVGALAPAVHHVGARVDARQRQAARRVPVARARAAHHHVVDAVVVVGRRLRFRFLGLWFFAGVII